MDFRDSERSAEYQRKVEAFLTEYVYPAERRFEEQATANRAAGTPYRTPAVLQELKAEARRRGLWNLFLPGAEDGAGLTVLDYAPIAELSGRSPAIAPEAMNCSAPDTGNMELLHMFATDEQRKAWL
ncbi:MAG TPA: acyl-CoA dehydrogenase family protein, partial [Jiangellaceae bacterium]